MKPRETMFSTIKPHECSDKDRIDISAIFDGTKFGPLPFQQGNQTLPPEDSDLKWFLSDFLPFSISSSSLR